MSTETFPSGTTTQYPAQLPCHPCDPFGSTSGLLTWSQREEDDHDERTHDGGVLQPGALVLSNRNLESSLRMGSPRGWAKSCVLDLGTMRAEDKAE